MAQFRSAESSWHVTAHGDAREGKQRGNWRMQWVASTLHTTSEHGVPSITTADAHTSAASSRLNWRPRRFKWTRPFRRKTKSGFFACAITFQMQSTIFQPLLFPAGLITTQNVHKWQSSNTLIHEPLNHSHNGRFIAPLHLMVHVSVTTLVLCRITVTAAMPLINDRTLPQCSSHRWHHLASDDQLYVLQNVNCYR